jgi:hypothetical protein
LRDDGRPAGDPERLGIPISGDDEQAKRTVAELIDEIGFDPVDGGTLAQGGRKHQPGSPAYTQGLPTAELGAALPREPTLEQRRRCVTDVLALRLVTAKRYAARRQEPASGKLVRWRRGRSMRSRRALRIERRLRLHAARAARAVGVYAPR